MQEIADELGVTLEEAQAMEARADKRYVDFIYRIADKYKVG